MSELAQGDAPFDAYPAPDTVAIGFLRVAVCAIVWDEEGRLLLQLRGDNGHWGFPGGGVEQGETVSAAVAREVLEETGYHFEPARIVGVYSDPARFQLVRYPDGNVIHYVSITFEGRVTGGVPTLCDETQALQWASPDALPEPFVPAHHLRLNDALQKRAAAFIA